VLDYTVGRQAVDDALVALDASMDATDENRQAGRERLEQCRQRLDEPTYRSPACASPTKALEPVAGLRRARDRMDEALGVRAEDRYTARKSREAATRPARKDAGPSPGVQAQEDDAVLRRRANMPFFPNTARFPFSGWRRPSASCSRVRT
jgi:hypothetical protein